jgi:hypothetical protein
MAPPPSLKASDDALFRRRLGAGDASRGNPDLVLLVTLLLGMLILALLALSARADERCLFEWHRYATARTPAASSVMSGIDWKTASTW